MTVEAVDRIELPQDVYDPYELTETSDSAVAQRVQRIYDTGELVTCIVSVTRTDGKWKAGFSLHSNQAGDSTYHAERELNALRAKVFPDAQSAMDTALDALSDGFDTLAAAREVDEG